METLEILWSAALVLVPVLAIGLIICFFIVVIWHTFFLEKNEKRRRAKRNWKLPGQWGARTTIQKDIVQELKKWRDNLIGPDYSEHYSQPDVFFVELEEAKKKIQEHNLNPRLLTKLAWAVHSYYAKRRLWGLATQVAQRYNL